MIDKSRPNRLDAAGGWSPTSSMRVEPAAMCGGLALAGIRGRVARYREGGDRIVALRKGPLLLPDPLRSLLVKWPRICGQLLAGLRSGQASSSLLETGD